MPVREVLLVLDQQHPRHAPPPACGSVSLSGSSRPGSVIVKVEPRSGPGLSTAIEPAVALHDRAHDEEARARCPVRLRRTSAPIR